MAVQTYENIQRLPPFLEGLAKKAYYKLLLVNLMEKHKLRTGLLDTTSWSTRIQIIGRSFTTRATELGEANGWSSSTFFTRCF